MSDVPSLTPEGRPWLPHERGLTHAPLRVNNTIGFFMLFNGDAILD